MQYLNTNKEITALHCGKLDPRKPDIDMVFIGSNTNLLVYDCTNNSDVFDKEVNDGLSSLCICGSQFLPEVAQPLVIIGGNCNITGFDVDGEERFWTVSGDNVQALELIDFDGDQVDELAAGSDDFAIRVFKGEEIIQDITEKAKVIQIARITNNSFGYALSNGAYGVYVLKKKQWKSKNKSKVSAICGCDKDVYGDGQKLLIVGFESGQIEVRKHTSGDIIFTTIIDNSGYISKLFYFDYRMSGAKQVIAVTSKGFIQGYSVNQNLK
jgi:Bardet-Biedl syndrome 2 protein